MTVTTITTTIVSGPTTNLTALFTQNATPAAPSTNNASVGVATNILGSAGVSSPTQKITADLLNNFIDSAPYFGNKIVDLDFSSMYNLSSRSFGEFFGADVPVASQADLGVGMLHLEGQWDLVPLSLKMGTTINYGPYIGNIYNFVGTGPLLDLNNGKLGSYNTLGGVKSYIIYQKLSISLGLGVSDISTIKGINLNGFLRLNLSL